VAELTWPCHENIIRKFWNRLPKGPKDKCWEWTGPRDAEGYGFLPHKGKEYMAHRVSWVITRKKNIPEGHVILHSCDNPPCCNPYHLTPGTTQENIADRVAKGRTRTRAIKGAEHYAAKFTWEQVTEIRELRESGMTITAIAKQFDADDVVVSDIVNHRTYKEERSHG
jgi:hypothetical protein